MYQDLFHIYFKSTRCEISTWWNINSPKLLPSLSLKHAHTHIPEEVGTGCGLTGILSLSLSPSLRRTTRRNRRRKKKRRKTSGRRQSLFSQRSVPSGGGGSDPLQGRAAGRLLVACEPQRLLSFQKGSSDNEGPGTVGVLGCGGPVVLEVREWQRSGRMRGPAVLGARGCQGSETDGGPRLPEVLLPMLLRALSKLSTVFVVVDLSASHLKANNLLNWLLVQLLPSWLLPKRSAHPGSTYLFCLTIIMDL